MITKTLSGFYVAGLSARTNNAAESSGQGRIPQLWAELFRSLPADSIENKVSHDIYAVYCEYESDHTGEYTYVLGYRVSSIDGLSGRLTAIRVPEGEYAVITSEEGPAMEVVPSVWRRIWALTPVELEGVRAYKADFEVYDQRAQDPSRCQIDVYAGIVRAAS
jgi:predicted transcriptional regulator YdeE